MEQVIDFVRYFWETKSDIAILTGQHLWLSFLGVLIGTLTAVPLGIIISRSPKLSALVIDMAGILYTVPSLAMLGFLLPFLGLGWLPTVVALVIYSWLPVLRNTCAGLAGIDPAVKEAAIGMGATPFQLLVRVELPLAFPVIMASVRTITVLTVGIATFGALVGGGGLGELIFTGISMMDNRMVLAGTIPVALMAVLFDQILGYVERHLRMKAGLA
ncbi:hypothetical protein Tph_c20160 [Thermacetogenium phaeum DSM 12270]|uniref:ABC transmembrane type-1 domain-containing protein n=1 Tax=Thermacetogenium phaeum (strain ATCC BAA-254 / DSM 26808 / PB) TaxID=1089553 RepID=K4LJS4_THEPS|nr:ABC transporter permease [Thermacetogenium phaeum]AFV12210.1 hypothetical protein Tph_c20160 [Thermacetogenium phaeum DSM 12270]